MEICLKAETGEASKKIMKNKGNGFIFKDKPIGAVKDYQKDAQEKVNATVSVIVHAITITSENIINICETGI